MELSFPFAGKYCEQFADTNPGEMHTVSGRSQIAFLEKIKSTCRALRALPEARDKNCENCVLNYQTHQKFYLHCHDLPQYHRPSAAKSLHLVP